MCGIAGKISFKGPINLAVEKPLIDNALAKLHHRGPDDKGSYIGENVWLASTRLSIIDLSEDGNMPMKNEDGSIFLVFNGEIYNYKELRDKLKNKHHFISETDTETLVHLYEDYGVECLKYLRGMFAFAIWDLKKKQLFIARDRLGKKPLKYFFNRDFFIFASELKTFINYPGVPKEIDFQALDQFLTMEYVPSPLTGFKGIYKLPPATYMIIDSLGRMETHRYWDLKYLPKENLSEEEWEEEILKKLNESVKLRLRSDVPLGIHLSGGIDSGLITALASQNSKKRLCTFSVGFGDQEFDELRLAKLVSDRYHTDHHEIILKRESLKDIDERIYSFEEPFADPSILPTWQLMEESRKSITVALNGDGGDENFAGYDRYKTMAYYALIKNLPFKHELAAGLSSFKEIFKARKFNNSLKLLRSSKDSYEFLYSDMINSMDFSSKEPLYSLSFQKKLGENFKENFLVNKLAGIKKDLNWLDQLLLLDLETYLPDNLMPKVDIASMAHSLEVRSPFLDHEFMELVAKMPTNLKIKNFKGKYILKKIARNYLPKEQILKKKQGFVPPMDNWLEFNKDYLKKEILEKDFLSFDLLKKETLKKMVDMDLSKNTRILWRLFCLKHWLALWFL